MAVERLEAGPNVRCLCGLTRDRRGVCSHCDEKPSCPRTGCQRCDNVAAHCYVCKRYNGDSKKADECAMACLEAERAREARDH